MGHRARYGHADEAEAFRDRLARVASHGEDAEVLLVTRGGRVVGFAALVLDGTRVVPRLIACEDNEVFVYFNLLLFYEPIRLGFCEIALGSTTYRAKLLRGGRLQAALDLDPGAGSPPLEPILSEVAAYRTDLELARRDALVALER